MSAPEDVSTNGAVYNVQLSPPANTEGEGTTAVRSYLNATLTPVLLKALMALDEQHPTPQRPILWLADYLTNYSDIG